MLKLGMMEKSKELLEKIRPIRAEINLHEREN